MTEQTENINRVRSQIANHICRYLKDHEGQEFHCESLRQYVYANVDGYIAPASPDRILRDLRQRGVVSYEVVNRAKSLYRALPKEWQPSLI
ncbi:hypothetical protein [Geitlerinema calcuttense]|uniref:Uncharacterized protein n=1 Tax=Geitlerinema calcuttense NRMC-F 0142 TaxID=2922238 RepID=A0ABT7LVC2_9CYAN|nr:hypothetical protein [Geitlerinema calcuttense]MDL5055924.1 hypothetical protein [Geitlerinema calcuttense NRMC-F 0142]